MKQIDNLINTKLRKRFGKSLERRDYYKLELKKEFLKGKGESSGIMFLVDVDYSHYIDINIYKNGLIKMVFRKDDDVLIKINVNEFLLQENTLEDYLDGFLSLIDEYKSTLSRFNQISSGIIPTDIKRYNVVNNILND
jgi:hypothetical protein